MGLLSKGNIDLHKRPIVRNKDGSISTVRSMSIGTDQGEVLIPTVSPDGRILDEQAAIDLYRKHGQHLGIFDSPDAATAYAKALHEQQAQEYKRPQGVGKTMGLLDFNQAGGLFGGLPPYTTPGIGDGIPGNRRMDGAFNVDPETESAINSYASMPAQEKRGGLFGSGYDGEDVMSMLLRAASIAQGDYGSAAQFGSNIGARARAEAEAAAQEAQKLRMYRAQKEIDREYTGPNLTEYGQALVEQGLQPGTPEFQQAMAQYNTRRADPTVTTILPGERFYSGPASGLTGALGATTGNSAPPQAAIAALKSNPGLAADFDAKYGPGASQRYLGGGSGNAAGGFPRR